MTRRKLLTILIVAFTFSLPAYANGPESEFKRGVQAESKNDYDGAFDAYKQAYLAKPRNAKYFAAYARIKFYAAAEHVRSGQVLRDSGKVNDALLQFQRAVEIDSSSFMAQQELRRTADILRKQAAQERAAASAKESATKPEEQTEGPVQLQELSNNPISLRMTANADVIYKIMCKLGGINVLVDPEYKPQRVAVELNNVTLQQALQMLSLQSKSFWRPVAPNTIFVTADSPTKRKETEQSVLKTFYVRNISSPTELQDAANTLRQILDVSRIQLVPTQNAMIVRGTPDQMVLAEKVLADIDKAKSEVVIDIAVMQVSRDRVRTLGTSPPTSSSISIQPPGSQGSSGGGQLTLNTLGSLNATSFLVNIPGASLSFLMSDSNTKILQNPQIRALDNQKATLKIGDRVPVATGSFQPGGAGISPLVNTQFQYLDVGVNIDIIPHVHSDHEVTLKMVLEISSVTSSQNIGGINQPVIGQRRIEHETRLMDGDVNLVGGILEDSETESLSGYPWLAKIPILKYLFAQENKERRSSEIVFAITPHIIRSQEVTEQNTRTIDVGTGNTIELRRKGLESNKATGTVQPSAPQPSQPVTPQSSSPVTPEPASPTGTQAPPAAGPQSPPQSTSSTTAQDSASPSPKEIPPEASPPPSQLE